ncbi:MAG: Inner membrane protein YedI [Stenotrophomonas maltophilia]|uniref:Inner membrane protein YedI n=1 Tax=Stenotrophomonas maltophilia TaxID=40324 RepID=A0A7V8FGJ0_STEMA|nr:MAG: Inner membrane protein YedI [Stenotrophomonas maltophilia]
MAGASLFALLDVIASLLDDVSVLTKVAAKKTAGVLGDDLALNAEQVTGVRANRELPVVWAVAKGSLLNKVILVPAALAISALEAWLHGRGWNVPLIVPLMMIGGGFLCFEGVEKLAHRFLHSADDDAQRQAERRQALADEQVDMVAWEKEKVKGAVRTDFILSAEIIVLTLGVVASAALLNQLVTLAVVAVAMTVFVYGLVAGIVKLDDVGFYLARKGGAVATLGRGLVASAPWLMKFLSVAGTVAMFLVGGGILVHNVSLLHHAVQALGGEGPWGWLVGGLANIAVGLVAGAVILAVVLGVQKLRGK